MPGSNGEAPGRGAPRGPLGPQAAALFVLFGLVLAVGEARPPAAEWAALATGGALAVWWSFRRSAPPPWSLVAFLLASAVLLAVRVDMGGAVVFVVIGTGLASVATAKRSCCGSSASVPPCSPGCWRGCAPVRRWR